MAAHSYSSKPIQIIEGQYLDQHKLMRLLKNVYGTSDEGKNNFRVEVCNSTNGSKVASSLTKLHSLDSIVIKYTHLNISAALPS
jgi:hypothetical protein